MKFSSWLEQRDPELYDEISRKWLLAPAILAGLGAGGAALRYSPPKQPTTITRSYDNPTPDVRNVQKKNDLKVELSGSGPISLRLDRYTILESDVGNVDITYVGKVNYFTKSSVNAIVNRESIMDIVKPGKSGENVLISTGTGGKQVRFADQDITVIIENRTFDISPNRFPEALRAILKVPVRVHISDGTIKLHGTGVIYLGGDGDSTVVPN